YELPNPPFNSSLFVVFKREGASCARNHTWVSRPGTGYVYLGPGDGRCSRPAPRLLIMTNATSQNPVRLLIVDDHKLFGAGLRMLIDAEPGMKVVGEAHNKAEALRLAVSEKPNLILLDIDLGGSDGLELLPELRETVREAKVLIVTGVKDQQAHRRAARLGAMGLVMKGHTPEVLLKAIKKVHQGEVWLDRSMMSAVLAELTTAANEHEAKIATLT